MQTLRGRFAPSPSGRMHLGNLFSALLAWLSVRRAGGVMVLRMEDLDPDRCRPEYARQLADDLRWLGLDWDEGWQKGGPHGPYLQSERTERYAAGVFPRAPAVRPRRPAAVQAGTGSGYGGPAAAVHAGTACRPAGLLGRADGPAGAGGGGGAGPLF